MSNYIDLINWLTSNNCTVHPSIQVEESAADEKLRGLYSTGHVDTNTVLCTIPSDLVISINNKCLQPFNNLGIPEYVRLTLWLCNESIQKEQSQYYQWCQLMPIYHDIQHNSIVQQRMKLTALLDDTTLQTALVSRSDELYDIYMHVYQYYCNQQNDHDSNNTDQHWFSKISFEHFCQADYSIWSRVLGLPDTSNNGTQQHKLALIPYIDLCNHTNDESSLNCRWEYNTTDDSVSLISTQPIPQSTQLYISYGNKSNTELLYLYMFALDDNQYDNCSIPLDIKSAIQHKPHDIMIQCITLIRKLHLNSMITIECDGEYSIDSWIVSSIIACNTAEQIESINNVYDAQSNNESESTDKITWNHSTALQQFDSTVLYNARGLLLNIVKQYRNNLPDTRKYNMSDTIKRYATYYVQGELRVLNECIDKYSDIAVNTK